ncbi:MAG: peptidoglycan DD-metalloendopeptidase family protein [Buchnera aphidicola (Brevicoryne brassicae)]|uniref:Peptidoglycan DD-metalloendopeptidase family protein n=1 Tax=Buchnera aphidicola (Brevicoryne brassicae) TaxID=911343 RepID=A0AAJ5TX69_9GAMM|nr:peptidoglycan DD-metalloendopeptidase family protein [Buchnera aphidicola]QCI19972.1 LysM peptidoglycan-binding domain-containing protein [Buchnera aphidicola (Brevicoryne brassicae)]WAI18797.1 MAG: peptidoglycan DD-metalloendopeptidase family protein [Buchnera aphidicola (Brevicoryne brassicae)]
MRLKKILYQLFFLMFMLIIFNNFLFACPVCKKYENISFYQKDDLNFRSSGKNIKNFVFLKKNECFSFLKVKSFFLKKKEFVISNNNFIGFFQKNKFKMFYVVKYKDTLYSIAKKSGHSYHELSKFNVIKKPYKIFVGQKIWIGDFFINKKNYSCSIKKINKKNFTSCKFIFENSFNISYILKNYNKKSIKICFFDNINSKKSNFFSKNKSSIMSKKWFWPVHSKNIKYFYDMKSKNKQIEIFGFRGQPVFASADGEVVCVTDLFEKYGRLIIIRHSKDYLSIYAFNDLILVKQRDKVHAKQKISTMGLSESNLVRLYFEIRYKGESVNPLNILPKINRKK